jgi:SAM-dependent methyltransferase
MIALPQGAPKACYGNWVSFKVILIPAVLGLVNLGLGFQFWPLFVLAAALLLACGYFLYARFLFSPRGADLQARIRGLLLAQLDWAGQGRALDIGCGSGALAIELARRCPEVQVLGIDSWGKGWDYSLGQCEANARLAGVQKRVRFQKASAAALPFPEASFDLVVSNLVFHEVREAKDKRRCMQEALRVLKPEGIFLLQDLFLLRGFFGSQEELLAAVSAGGANDVQLVRTCDAPFIPRLLKLPFMLGALALLRGSR